MKKILMTLFFGTLAPAMLSANSITYYQDEQNVSSSPFSSLTANPNTATEQSALTLSSAQWGANRPLDVSVTFSQLYGAIFSAQYTKRLGNYNAASLLADGSDKQYRLNLTWGAQFYPRQLIKVSVEHLAQKMKFDFDTQDERTWISQNAYGVEYKFLRPRQLLNDVNIKWYYSQAESKNLDSITYFQNGAEWRNDRHIAGGRAQGGSAGVHFLSTKHTLIGTAVNYSAVNYDSRYNAKNSDSRGIGGSLSLEQLLSKQIKVHFIASDMVPLQHYEAGIEYTPLTGIGKHLNIALAFARDIGDSDLPDDSQATLRLSYVWQDQPVIADASAKQLPGIAWDHLTLGATGDKQDLMAWTRQPAVKMTQVLAIADQRLVKVRNIVMISLSNNGVWVVDPDVFKKTLKAEPIKSGTITIDTLNGTLDETAVLKQLATASDSQGAQLGEYLNFDIISESSHTIKVSAALRGDAPQFSGSDTFHIIESDNEGNVGSTNLKLTMVGTRPKGNSIQTTITIEKGTTINNWPIAANSFESSSPITGYKLCANQNSSSCSNHLDNLTISADGKISSQGPIDSSIAKTYLLIAANMFGYDSPSADGPKLVITAGGAPQGHNVNTLLYRNPNQTIPSQSLAAGSFTIGNTTAEKAVTYKLCPNQTDLKSCKETLNGVTISADQDGQAHISGTAPEATVTDWVIAQNEFGTSSLKDGPSVKVSVGTPPQGSNVAESASTVANGNVNVSFDTIPFTPATGISDYQICSAATKQCGHTIEGLSIELNGNKLTVHGNAPDLSGTHTTTYEIIATNAYGTSTPSTNGPRVLVNTGPAPDAVNVTTKTPTDVAPSSEVNITLRSDSFSSTTGIKNYLLCPDSSNFNNCSTTVNGLSIDNSGHISGHAPSDSAGKDLTEWVVAKNQYGYSKLSDDAPKVKVTTYSSNGPTITIVPGGHWGVAGKANLFKYTVTVTPSKGNTFSNNGYDVYTEVANPVKDNNPANPEPSFSTFYHVNSHTNSTSQVQVAFGNSIIPNGTVMSAANYFLMTIKDARGHTTTRRINVDLYGAHKKLV